MQVNEIDGAAMTAGMAFRALPEPVRRFRAELDTPLWSAPAAAQPRGLEVDARGIAKAYGAR